jgi:hypothetical protein
MDIKIVKNIYINSLLILMLFSATIHMVILFFIALINIDFYVLNYFNIIDLDILFPELMLNNFLWNTISIMVVVLFYFLILKIVKKNVSDK